MVQSCEVAEKKLELVEQPVELVKQETSFAKFGERLPVSKCGACIFDNKLNKVLMVKQRDGKWGFPKGQLEKNECCEMCMKREVYEETGFILHDSRYTEMKRVKRDSYLIFILRLKNNQKTTGCKFLIQDNQEIEQVKWVKIDEMKDYSLNSITRYVYQRRLPRLNIFVNV